jgi:hypothetical protein
MAAFLLIVAAVLSRVLPHPAWLNFTAVGGALLYFGARRPLRQIWIPVAALAATDFYLTAFFYSYPFHFSDYLLTWAWYAAVVALGFILLSKKTTASRVVAGVLIAPTSFFLITNFAAWAMQPQIYPRDFVGLTLSYVAGLPFYRNDVVSTAIVAAVAFGLPALARQMAQRHQVAEI